MRLTIIKRDNTVYVDGVALTVDCASLPAEFHALQWYDTFGEVEMVDGFGNMTRNEPIADLGPYQALVEAWNSANAAIQAASAAKVAAQSQPGTVNVIAAG
jgi:hypothetical protein